MSHHTLIDVATLAANLQDPTWVVVDCRFRLGEPDFGREAFVAGTIPGSVFADVDRDLSSPVVPGVTGRHPLPDPDELAVTLGRLGIDEDTQVVAFDQAGGAFAARLWWLLRWLGHDTVAVLDGGIDAWTAAGHALAPGGGSRRSAYFAPHPRRELAVTPAAVLGATTDDAIVLLDARATDRYRGQNETIDPVAGHVPSARSAPHTGNLGPDGRFLSPDELRARYEALLGGAKSGDAICYCGSGITACHDILAMTHAGLRPPRLYPGSWSEWITDPARPVATGDEPG
jgi:thiosulfate/3-mercaptopyruvate sulfurtransferase